MMVWGIFPAIVVAFLVLTSVVDGGNLYDHNFCGMVGVCLTMIPVYPFI